MVCLKRSIIASALLGIFCSSCFAAAIEKSSLHWALNSGEIAADDCTITDDGEAYYLTAAQSESLSITADAPVRFHFVNSLSDEEKWQLYSLTLLQTQTARVDLKTPISIVLETDNHESTVGLHSINLQETVGESLRIEVIGRNSGWATNSVAWLVSQSQADPLPEKLHLSATAINTEIQGDSSAIALKIENAAFSHAGEFHLLANQQSSEGLLSEAAAIKLTDSQIELKSTGNSRLKGDIIFEDMGGEPNSLQLTLANPDDHWSGRVYSYFDSQTIQPMTLTLANGATWSTTLTSSLETFHWKKGGILDISEASEPVDIGLRDHSDVDNSHKTYVETGAVLRIKVTDQDIGTGSAQGRFKLQIEDINAVDKNSEILVQIIDEREKTADQTEGLDIGLVRFNTVAGGIHFAADQYRYETALGTYETVAEFGSAPDLGTVINAIGTERIGLSTLSQNRVDYLSGEIIAHEMLLTNTARQLSSRFGDEFGKPQRGLWVDLSVAQTDLDFNDGQRGQTLKSKTLTIGYDHAMDMKALDDGFVGLWSAFGQNESDFSQGSAEADHWAAGLYAGGYSSDRRKMMIHAFYSQANGDFTSQAYAADDRAATALTFDTKSNAYGLGLYIGFPLVEPGNQRYAIEPFIAADTYWIKPKNEQNGEVGFASETIHQSVARIGVQGAYNLSQFDQRLTLKSDFFWAHRFAGAHELIGTEAGQREAFQTEDLQESWAEAGFGVLWTVKDQLSISGSVRGALAQEVTPKYRINLLAQYFFK